MVPVLVWGKELRVPMVVWGKGGRVPVVVWGRVGMSKDGCECKMRLDELVLFYEDGESNNVRRCSSRAIIMIINDDNNIRDNATDSMI